MRSNSAPSKTERNYSSYLKKLATLAEEEDRGTRPDKRVIQMLAQIKDHYRNPIVAVDTASPAVKNKHSSVFMLMSSIKRSS